jgi:two-component system CheB/CheR fusion protein
MASETTSAELEGVLEYIKAVRGFDFTGYKRPSLRRRFEKRMQEVRVESYPAYQEYLADHPDEFVELFNTILINVTAFFRDLPAWDYLRREIVPRIVEDAEQREAIRIWSTGCASGEEAYSLAICFAEVLDEADFDARVKIYATDVDEHALSEARHGLYTSSKLETLPDDLRERYFERVEQGWLVAAPLRRTVIFGRHDVVHDPPISHIDLLASRNTLMYFVPETQQRVLANFHFALHQAGYLFLGKSEMMLGRSNMFTPVDLRRRVFQKVAYGDMARVIPRARTDEPSHDGSEALVRDAGFEAAPVAQLVIDRTGSLALANLQARALFNLAQGDIGRPLKDLDVSYKPIELRSQIEKAITERHALTLRDIEWVRESGEQRVLDVHVIPLSGRDGTQIGVSIAFADTTRYKRLQDAMEHSKRDVEAAYEELQSAVEELETTNEELQSTNEELETTNEELQSTNEELETMNEELQSTNEELETINDEVNQRTDELNQANFFLESILASMDSGIVVLDDQLRVTAWNAGARDLWGLLPEEVDGQHFMSLDIGLPVETLRGTFRAALDGEETPLVAVKATNRRGRHITCRVRVSPLRRPVGGIGRGLIVFMDELE